MSYRQRQQSRSTSWRHPPSRRSIILVCVCLLVMTCILIAFSMTGCGSTSVSSNCTSSSHPTPMPTVTHVVPPIATSPATRTPIPTFSATVSPPGSLAPTPSPVITASEETTDTLKHYKALVVQGDKSSLHKAYNLLSPDIRNRESFEDFVNDPNYTLPKGCLVIGDVTVTQSDSLGQIWDGSIPVTQVSCVDQVTEVTYSWHFKVSLANGYAEIISIGLYPTGRGSVW